MSFSSLRTLDFYCEVTSKNLYSLFKFPLLDKDSAPPFAFEVCLNLCKSSGYPERRLRMSLTNLQWSANDACPSCRIICEGLQPCDLCDERAVIALSELGVSYVAVAVTNCPVNPADNTAGSGSLPEPTMFDFFPHPR
jgi:hypothetical protein